jgi:hypothetical protein
MSDQQSQQPGLDADSKSRRLRFKSSQSHSKGGKSRRDHRKDDSESSTPRRRSRSPRQHHGKQRHRERTPEGAHVETDPLDPDEAFRESLFDALADDEGALYWEGVYGQPIHIYANEKLNGVGELEMMTDEEYAEFVRTKMWERSHQHIVEERERRRKEMKKQREQNERERGEDRSRAAFNSLIDDALRQGRRRKKTRDFQNAWASYLDKWERFLEAANGNTINEGTKQRHPIALPWPVESGHEKDVSKDSVESFFRKNPADDLLTILKVERVRWHPDKMQQRLRAANLDSSSLPLVTAVFQILDDMWTNLKRNTTK